MKTYKLREHGQFTVDVNVFGLLGRVAVCTALGSIAIVAWAVLITVTLSM